MNHYFRLLFVGSILFILLGLFNEQSEDTIAQNQVPFEIEYVEFQPGLLPTSLGTQPIPSIFTNTIKKLGDIYFNPKHYENQISKWIDNRFYYLESVFKDRKDP